MKRASKTNGRAYFLTAYALTINSTEKKNNSVAYTKKNYIIEIQPYNYINTNYKPIKVVNQVVQYNNP